jgi:anti-sigma regulatory factor (Ser/Thr protein kinase)
LKLSVSDSGDGFDYKNWSLKHQEGLKLDFPSNVQPLSGRGLALVKKLTDSLSFSENGSRIEVEFKLNDNYKTLG